jgi:hypothetical protein
MMNEHEKARLTELAEEGRKLLTGTTLFGQPVDVTDIDHVLAAFICMYQQQVYYQDQAYRRANVVADYTLHLTKAE